MKRKLGLFEAFYYLYQKEGGRLFMPGFKSFDEEKEYRELIIKMELKKKSKL